MAATGRPIDARAARCGPWDGSPLAFGLCGAAAIVFGLGEAARSPVQNWGGPIAVTGTSSVKTVGTAKNSVS